VRGISPLAELCENIFHDSRSALQDIVIPISHHAETFVRQRLVSHHVVRRFRVLASIDLDDKPSLETDEVQDVVLERDLAAKFELRETTVAQQSPHRGLRICRLTPHSPGERAEALCDWSMMRFLRHEPLTRRASRATLSHKGRG
jgi:hypothetical protein